MLELAAKFKQRTNEIIGATFVLIKAKQACSGSHAARKVSRTPGEVSSMKFKRTRRRLEKRPSPHLGFTLPSGCLSL